MGRTYVVMQKNVKCSAEELGKEETCYGICRI